MALAVGWEIDGWDGSASSDRSIDRATLAIGSSLDGRDLPGRVFSSSMAGRWQVRFAAVAHWKPHRRRDGLKGKGRDLAYKHHGDNTNLTVLKD